MKRNLYLEFLGRGLSINRYNTMLIVSYVCLLYNKGYRTKSVAILVPKIGK